MKKIGNRRARLKEEIEPQLVFLEWFSNKGVVSMRRVWSSKEKSPNYNCKYKLHNTNRISDAGKLLSPKRLVVAN